MTIIREERIGDCRLILGDCLEVLPTLGKVDAIVTSPPYNCGKDYGTASDKKGKTEYRQFLKKALGHDARSRYPCSDAGPAREPAPLCREAKRRLAAPILGRNLAKRP